MQQPEQAHTAHTEYAGTLGTSPDGTPDPALDRATRIAAVMLDAPGALVKLLGADTHVVKSAFGSDYQHLAGTVAPIGESLSQYVRSGRAPFVVADTLADARLTPRTARNGIRAFLGVPLFGFDGTVAGSLCAVSGAPRQWTDADVRRLADLAELTSDELQVRTLRQVTEHAATYRRAHDELTRALAESSDLADAAPRVLRSLATALGWHVGALWMVDATGTKLEFCDSWVAPGVTADPFMAPARAFSRGEGVIGRVWSSGQPAWADDLAVEPRFLRQDDFVPTGLHTHVAVPVGSGYGITGVLELFHRERLPRSQQVTDMLVTMALQLNQFITARAGGAWQHPPPAREFAVRQLGVSAHAGDGLAGTSFTDAGHAAAVTTAGLTPREHDVLVLVARGMKNQQVAAELGIGVDTVKSHVSSILRKLGVASRSAAIVEGLRLGIVPP